MSRFSQDYPQTSQHQPPRSYYDTNPDLETAGYSSYEYPAHARESRDMGMRRQDLYDDGEERDEPFDIRADFDGVGPKYSEVYGNGNDAASYYPVHQHTAPSAHGPTRSESAYGAPEPKGRDKNGVELVSVPVLGPEWKRDELHAMTRRGEAEAKQEKRWKAWRSFKRDQRGLCGVSWLSRKVLVIVLFFFIVGLGLTLYFTIPRAPTFKFYEPTPFTVDNSTISFSRTPTNFTFTGNLNLQADATSSYLPVQFSDIEATLYDLNTNKKIATGNYGSHKVAKEADQPVILPVTFSYGGINATDTTWTNMYNACGHLWPGTTRPDLKFRLVLKMSIVGLVTKPSVTTQISDVTCPFELPVNSV